MKLYKRVNRLKWRKNVSKRKERVLRWALSLNEGDIINDCSAFNARISKIKYVIDETRNGWYIYDVDFVMEDINGEPSNSCSLNHCGLQPPKTPNQIEQWFKRFYDDLSPQLKQGWGYGTETDQIWLRMQKGLPLCDENGFRIYSVT